MEKAGPIAIEIKNLCFQYDQRLILANFNCEIPKGSFTGVIGPNGSGKTTLLKCITKFLPPKAGQVFLNGQDLAGFKVKEIAKKVGVVPQRAETSFAFKVIDFIRFGRYPHHSRSLNQLKIEQEQAVIHQAMVLTNTLELADRLITEISGGEFQRVIIAQTLAQTPEILLLDEPTNSLDLNYQIEMCSLFKRLAQQNGLTILAVLHDLNFAAQYCDHLILLKNGSVLAAGKTLEVLTKPNLKQVFGINLRVYYDTRTGQPLIDLNPQENDNVISNYNTTRSVLKIHIIGGGGSIINILRVLNSKQYQLSTGVLNISDSDWVMAKELSIPIVEEVPFNPISDTAHQDNLEMIDNADIVILGNIPFGPGNLNNLYAARYALQSKKTLLIFNFTSIKERDFTGGSASHEYNNLITKSGKAILINSIEEMLNIVNR